MMNIFTTTAYPVLKETEDIPSEETKEGTTKDGDRPHRYYPQIDESQVIKEILDQEKSQYGINQKVYSELEQLKPAYPTLDESAIINEIMRLEKIEEEQMDQNDDHEQNEPSAFKDLKGKYPQIDESHIQKEIKDLDIQLAFEKQERKKVTRSDETALKNSKKKSAKNNKNKDIQMLN